MKNIMTRAWEIAKEGASKFGGKSVEYLSASMKIAWAEFKGLINAPKFAMIETLSGSRRHKTWVAKIVGKCNRFGFKRDFIDFADEWLGGKEFRLWNGNTYEICNGGERSLVKIEDGEIIEVEKEEVLAAQKTN